MGGDDFRRGLLAPPRRRPQPVFGDVLAARLTRRGMLKGLGAAAGVALFAPGRALSGKRALTFAEIDRAVGPDHAVAAGYRVDVLLRWGDPVLPEAPPFAPDRLAADAQQRQFGYNNDFVAYLPLPAGSGSAEHGLLFVNHEYTNRELMWPGMVAHRPSTPEEAAVEMAAHGASVVEVRKAGGRWAAVKGGRFNRRISAAAPPMRIGGPAAGHPRLRTTADPEGRHVLGTLNNCAGGVTPWGTVLTCEENFHYYFGGDPGEASEAENYRRYGLTGGAAYFWYLHERRFDLEHEPNEPNRFGWVVEIDPYDPEATPVKRTALGRLKHEGAETAVSADGRVAVYSGDDEAFEYVYRFVSEGAVDPRDRAANRDLLDRGTLAAARFNPDGTLDWLPLVFGRDGLDPKNGFASQADVLIEARRAADVVGATPMDRPEDITVDPLTGRVYVMLTRNSARTGEQTDAANPRANNRFGHVLELTPPAGDRGRQHAAARFHWEIFLFGRDPSEQARGSSEEPSGAKPARLLAPDNGAFDPWGRLWITTDQGRLQGETGVADGVYACETQGPRRARPRFFYKVPVGAECTGPCFTPDGRTLFLAVQHPAEGSTFDEPSTRWPDFDSGVPPRPSVVAVTKADGGEIGG